MLRRIAVVGSEVLLDAARRVADDEAEIVQVSAGERLPEATAAVLADGEGLDSAVVAAMSLGARQEEMLNLLAEAIDCREAFAPGSSQRVEEHAARFAQALNMKPNEQLVLERGALLRDIGKLKIPNDVLLKNGVLTYDEWVLLQKHPHIGGDLVSSMDGLKDVADIVRSHHECFNGEGYPDGLEGEAIPRMARIVKIIDVYCAMTSPRHYRKGCSTHQGAVDFLRTEKGKHFDPALVDVFIDESVGVPEEDS